jgi:hypothetical protein
MEYDLSSQTSVNPLSSIAKSMSLFNIKKDKDVFAWHPWKLLLLSSHKNHIIRSTALLWISIYLFYLVHFPNSRLTLITKRNILVRLSRHSNTPPLRIMQLSGTELLLNAPAPVPFISCMACTTSTVPVVFSALVLAVMIESIP